MGAFTLAGYLAIKGFEKASSTASRSKGHTLSRGGNVCWRSGRQIIAFMQLFVHCGNSELRVVSWQKRQGRKDTDTDTVGGSIKQGSPPTEAQLKLGWAGKNVSKSSSLCTQ